MTETSADVMAAVLDVACLTEDRSPGEQQAMLTAALAVDWRRRHTMPPTMVAHVEATYDPSLDDSVSLSPMQRSLYEAIQSRWSA